VGKKGCSFVNLHTELEFLVDDTVSIGGRWTRAVARQLYTSKEEIDKLWIDKLPPIKAYTTSVVDTYAAREVVLCRVKLVDEHRYIDQVNIVWTRLLIKTLLRVVDRLVRQRPV